MYCQSEIRVIEFFVEVIILTKGVGRREGDEQKKL
jgi:hypothetical protein